MSERRGPSARYWWVQVGLFVGLAVFGLVTAHYYGALICLAIAVLPYRKAVERQPSS